MDFELRQELEPLQESIGRGAKKGGGQIVLFERVSIVSRQQRDFYRAHDISTLSFNSGILSAVMPRYKARITREKVRN